MTTNNYLSLTTFVPGTKAKADEVNSNFNILKEALMTKAETQGDSTQTFYVKDAQDAKHAVNKSQLDDLEEDLLATFAKTGYRFCVRSGNTTNGSGDLFSYSNLTVSPKIGGSYAHLIVADYTGKAYTITSANAFTMQGKSDGTYNVFINSDSEIYVLKNTIYTQKARPNLIDGDIWLNTSCEPLSCIKYTNNSDENFFDVPIGVITIEDGLISEIKTVDYLTNGYDVTYNNLLCKYMPDYSSGISKTASTYYTAEEHGVVYFWGLADGVYLDITYNEVSFTFSADAHYAGQGHLGSGFYPIPKGAVYRCRCSGAVTFFPLIGVK